VLVSDRFGLDTPEEGLISFEVFVETQLYPLHTEREEEFKALRRDVRSRFVLPGGPGEQLYPVFLDASKLLPDQEHVLFTSVLKLIQHLVEIEHKSKGEIEFSIVFRSFGSDFPHVIKDFNQFCRGEHPDFSEFKAPHLCISPEQLGLSSRIGDRACDTCLIVTDQLDELPASNTTLVPEKYETNRVIFGMEDISEFLKEHKVFAIRDQYRYWSKTGRERRGGKWIPLRDDTLVLFFDDGIAPGDNLHNIIDPRKIPSGEEINIVDLMDTTVFRVDTLQAILNPNYYVELVDRALTSHGSKS